MAFGITFKVCCINKLSTALSFLGVNLLSREGNSQTGDRMPKCVFSKILSFYYFLIIFHLLLHIFHLLTLTFDRMPEISCGKSMMLSF